MPRTVTVPLLVIASLAASVAAATGPDLGPDSADAADATIAWLSANDPEFVELYDDLEAQLQAALSRGAYRSDLVSRVVAGDLSFADAAAEFLRLNHDAGAMATLRWRFPGRSDQELAHWNVIEYVRGREMPAGEKARVLARLDSEFEARFGRPPCGPF